MGGRGGSRICAVLLLVVLGLAWTGSAHAEAPESPIATTARKYLGTRGGQCWTFMQKVVKETTGRSMVGDYRRAYLDAGAVEVSKEDAASGDIIQIALDGNSGPWASYPGLHTAIVLKNLSGGRFDAIDSNQNWDEMVSLRPDYDPYTAASRYGLQVHIYRFTPGALPPVAPKVAPSLVSGTAALVDADGDCLNLRSAASPTATKITCLGAGTALTILGAPVSAGGMAWVQVQTPAGKGWVASQFLSAPPSAAPAAQQAPAPQPAVATAPETTAPAVAAAAEPEAADTSPAAEEPGELAQAHVDNSPGCLRMRNAAGTDAGIVACLAAATPVTLLDEPRITANGYEWAHVRAAGKDGWVAAEYLVLE